MTIEQHRRPLSIDVRLDALSETEWRVCDRRLDESDHQSILGFIELRDGQFEVTTMSAPGERKYFDSLAHARAAFAPFAQMPVHTGKLRV